MVVYISEYFHMLFLRIELCKVGMERIIIAPFDR